MSWKAKLTEAIFDEDNINLIDSSPLLLMHLLALTVFIVPFHWSVLVVCAVTYAVRVFALTGGYHRYFSHKTYKTSRVFQFILAWLGASAAQCGPLWWASHHRHHHLHADTDKDIHSPKASGFFWAHMGWLMCRKYAQVMHGNIKDFAAFPELRFIDRFHVIPALALAFSIWGIGMVVGIWVEGISGWSWLAWGFFFSTALVYHATFCINSVTHIVGTRRFKTSDTSRNNFFTALLTFGEGWHNNHHRYPKSTRQGFYWWEIDATYYVLKTLSFLRIVWDIQQPPASLFDEARRNASA